MSLKNHTKVETNRYQLEVEVDAKTFDGACERAYKKNVVNMNIAGFRKGKAPRGFVEKMYGAGVFYEDAINDVYPMSISAAAEEAGLVMIDDKVDFDLVDASKENGLSYKATITVKPEVTVKDYKGIAADKTIKLITGDDVEEEIKKVQERNSRQVTVEDRPAEMGDITSIDFDGYLNDEPFEGGKAEKFSLTLGSGQFIPGFEEQVVGHSVGEDFDVNVTFPEDYQAEELKGQAVVFKIHLHEIKAKELPQLDDEFAKDVSEFDTLDEYKADIRTKLTEAADKKSSDDMENELITSVIGSMEAEIPEAMYERQIDQNMQDFEYRLQSQGMNMQTYMQYTGMDMEAFRGNFCEQAERQVKIRLALEKIVELEEITASEEDIEAEYNSMAENYKMEVEKIKAIVPAKDIERDMAVKKAIDLITSTAKVKEIKE